MLKRIRTGFKALVFLTALCGLMALLSSNASAQGKNPYRAVSSKDADGDGKISPDEWPRSTSIFKKLDKDKDGFLTPEDFAKHWGIALPEKGAAAGDGKKKKRRGGGEGAKGNTDQAAGQACAFENADGSDGEYIIETYSPSCTFAGTTLFADNADGPKISEIDMNGNVVWQHDPGSGDMVRCNQGRCKTEYGPLEPMDVTRLANGNTLYVANRHGIYEVDTAGNVVWKHLDDKASHDVDRLANGNTLYARGWVETGDDHLREVNPDGATVWSWDGMSQYNREPYNGVDDQGWIHVNAATRMPNGNTWISLRNFDIFAEVDPAGAVVREVKLPLPGAKINEKDRKRHANSFKLVAPHDPEVQANGNLLIAHAGVGGLLVETDPSGQRIVFQKRFRRPSHVYHIRDANRLPNGNILISSATRLVEITAQGRVVWKMKRSKLGDRVKNNKQFFKAIRIAPDGTVYGG